MSLPFVVTGLAFQTLATIEDDELHVGTPLVAVSPPAVATITPELVVIEVDLNIQHEAAMHAYEVGEYRSAERQFRELIELIPEAHGLYNDLALTLIQQGRFTEAVTALKVAISNYKTDEEADMSGLHTRGELAEIYNNMGLAQHKLGNWVESETYYQMAIVDQPTLAIAHNGLGNLFIDTDRIEEAIEAYQNGIEQDPMLIEAYLSLGSAYAKLENYDSAAEVFKAALTIEPTLREAQYNLAIVYANDGQIEASRKILEKLMTLDSQDEWGILAKITLDKLGS